MLRGVQFIAPGEQPIPNPPLVFRSEQEAVNFIDLWALNRQAACTSDWMADTTNGKRKWRTYHLPYLGAIYVCMTVERW